MRILQTGIDVVVNAGTSVARVAKATLEKVDKTAMVVGGSVGAVAVEQAASAQVTLPTPFDVGEYVTAGITGLGAVVAVVAGGYFAWLIVKKGFSWGRKAFG